VVRLGTYQHPSIVGQEQVLGFVYFEVIRNLLTWQLWFSVTFILFLASSCPGYLDIACKSANGDM
jgi:hypothetical protein